MFMQRILLNYEFCDGSFWWIFLPTISWVQQLDHVLTVHYWCFKSIVNPRHRQNFGLFCGWLQIGHVVWSLVYDWMIDTSAYTFLQRSTRNWNWEVPCSPTFSASYVYNPYIVLWNTVKFWFLLFCLIKYDKNSTERMIYDISFTLKQQLDTK
jgi:hypothetical protein